MGLDDLVVDALFLKVISMIKSSAPNINLVSSEGAEWNEQEEAFC